MYVVSTAPCNAIFERESLARFKSNVTGRGEGAAIFNAESFALSGVTNNRVGVWHIQFINESQDTLRCHGNPGMSILQHLLQGLFFSSSHYYSKSNYLICTASV